MTPRRTGGPFAPAGPAAGATGTATGAARHRLAALLDEVATPGDFTARATAPPRDLHLEIRGVGPLTLPVTRTQAAQLCRLGRPARYGQGERTLLDRGVRDTWQIPRSRIRLDKRRWNATLLPALDRLRDGLGLPPGCRLEARFHSMLVYGPGQFFAPHQDSETDDTMIGSLVVTLPSAASGGALVVEHDGVRVTHRASKTSLSFVAFYGDCRHEVRPVRSGYRVVLTYHLLARGDTTPAPASDGDLEPLVRCLHEHFATPVPAPSGTPDRPPGPPPRRLVHLLDHGYSERAISWSRLKGGDATRAALLRAAAQRADCSVALALAEVHETWSAYEPTPPRHRRWTDRWDWEDETALDGRPDPGQRSDPWDDYELDELIESEITLDRWVDDSGAEAEAVLTTVTAGEVSEAVPSSELRPYAVEYEGYMGNYGNTMDRWYRRAAVVVWPNRLTFAVRAEAAPRTALDALAERLRRGERADARRDAATLAPFWDQVAAGDHGRRFTTAALRVADRLDDADLAAMLLRPLGTERLAATHAKALAAVTGRYGPAWAEALVAAWTARDGWRATADGRWTWMSALGPLGAALHAAGPAGTAIGGHLVAGSWRQLRSAVDHRRTLLPPSRRDDALGQLGPPTLGVLQAVAALGAADLRAEIVDWLRDGDDLVPLVMAVLRTASSDPGAAGTAGLDALALHCSDKLRSALAAPPRAEGDWSIELPAGCSCELCTTLARFLADPARRSLEWPLAQARRQHVHARIESHQLPVRHQTRRSGRPYTLVLTKMPALFEQEAQLRQRHHEDLAVLATWTS
jgi:predicted 2-oxoglutarate/Fe(II)-dependent dioxygenase YbiX